MPVDFVQVDVFTHRPLHGNPAAVVFDADGIPGEVMQRIAREMNLSETVFLVEPATPEADYRVRTFAPGEGVPEDPVCGSGNGSVAAHVARHRHAEEASGSYLAEQGIEIGRNGLVHAAWERRDGSLRVKIAGEAVTVASGQRFV